MIAALFLWLVLALLEGAFLDGAFVLLLPLQPWQIFLDALCSSPSHTVDHCIGGILLQLNRMVHERTSDPVLSPVPPSPPRVSGPEAQG